MTDNGGGSTGHDQPTPRPAQRTTQVTLTNDVTPAPSPSNDSAANPVTIRQEVIKAMLERSFMRPLKGKSRDYCKMGHKLELPIGIDWMKDVNEKKIFPGFSIVSLHKVGLVSKKNQPWAKDSIDFIAFVHDDNNACLQLWGIEIKSRQTNVTISKEKEHHRRLRCRKHTIVSSKEAHRVIQKVDERFQILHHAFVYGFERVALVIGDVSGKVIKSTTIEFEERIHDAYKDVVNEMKNIALLWAYDNTTDVSSIIIPDEVLTISENVKTINGEETLYGALKLWKVMYDNPSILPRPVIKRIIPSTHAHWNATKGGSDTITKLVDDCVLKPPRCHTNFESVATSRCISNLCAAIFKLYHIITAKPDLAASYPSLSHYRNAASSRLSFKCFLRMLYQIFKRELNGGERDEGESSSNQEEQGPMRGGLRSRQFQGTVPSPMQFAPKPTFKTPKKARKKMINKGDVDKNIIQRMKECTGFPYEVFCQQTQQTKTKDPRQACYLCGAKTKWQCINCRLYFCLTTKDKKHQPAQYYITNEKENTDCNREDVSRIYGKSCFHVAHEEAIQTKLRKD